MRPDEGGGNMVVGFFNIGIRKTALWLCISKLNGDYSMYKINVKISMQYVQ